MCCARSLSPSLVRCMTRSLHHLLCRVQSRDEAQVEQPKPRTLASPKRWGRLNDGGGRNWGSASASSKKTPGHSHPAAVVTACTVFFACGNVRRCSCGPRVYRRCVSVRCRPGLYSETRGPCTSTSLLGTPVSVVRAPAPGLGSPGKAQLRRSFPCLVLFLSSTCRVPI